VEGRDGAFGVWLLDAAKSQRSILETNATVTQADPGAFPSHMKREPPKHSDANMPAPPDEQQQAPLRAILNRVGSELAKDGELHFTAPQTA
jgi:hypothetical protein